MIKCIIQYVSAFSMGRVGLYDFKEKMMVQLMGLIFIVLSGTQIYEVETGKKFDCNVNPDLVCEFNLND